LIEIISIIPARRGSKGIPLKNLALLNNKSLLYHTVSASLNSKLITRTIVSTDSDKIGIEAKRIGAEVIKRPKKISNNKIAIEPAMLHVLKKLAKTEGYKPTLIVLLQNTSPLRNSNHIDDAIKLLKRKKYTSVLSGFRSHYLLWKVREQNVFPVNYNPMKRLNRQQMTTEFIENGAIYITKNSNFEKTHCRISGKIGLYIMPEELSIQIDSKMDLTIAEQIMKWNKN